MPRPTEPAEPKSLADPSNLAVRRALLNAPHLRALRVLGERISRERDAPVPFPDPLDGGGGARLLLLLETPGPAIARTGFVSRDNPTGTAANLFRFLNEAGIARRDTLIWNVVPWVIHAEGALNRTPRRTELEPALPYLKPLLACLPRLALVVLAGRFAAAAEEPLKAHDPALTITRIPHPSPTYVCTAPSVRERIAAGLGDARLRLDALRSASNSPLDHDPDDRRTVLPP